MTLIVETPQSLNKWIKTCPNQRLQPGQTSCWYWSNSFKYEGLLWLIFTQ